MTGLSAHRRETAAVRRKKRERIESMRGCRVLALRFGAHVHVRRIELGMTLEDVANATGVTKSHVSRVEHGQAALGSAAFFLRVCRLLDLDPRGYLDDGGAA